MIFRTSECASSAINNSKINDFQVLILTPFWVSFWRCFGSPVEAEAIKKPSQKIIKKMMPKMTPNWSQRGSRNGAKIVKNEVLEAPRFKVGSQMASRTPPGSILERFWDHFETMFVSCSAICSMFFACISVATCCKQKRSKLQVITKRMQQGASKKQLVSSCHLASKSSLANVNELSGPC